jgi:Leucine-rich repeat (LRR) protein
MKIDVSTNVITEEWIRKKLNINHDNLGENGGLFLVSIRKVLSMINLVFLDDVKGLSLPGTYQEKITHLSSSLVRFTRLKELDLSRNSIMCLEGLESLKYLEKLNL